MKQILFSILIIVSLQSFGQGNMAKDAANIKPPIPDTADIKKQQEEANKFVTELVTKTSIKDFQAWLYENNAGVKDFEVFNRLYNAFIQSKYATKPKK